LVEDFGLREPASIVRLKVRARKVRSLINAPWYD
jgi:hypothetical protein